MNIIENITEKIYNSSQKLPESLQLEVLDFIEYLIMRVEPKAINQDEMAWSDFSRTTVAIRGMEDKK
ncbi:MAG: DUF2281 domain-containing protein [Nitrospinae bacterium]|nr:DUF2281 domain-containing protein [Nitrospinota bacterium]